jgi:glycerophosphoryl diester phosphodiesterase
MKNTIVYLLLVSFLWLVSIQNLFSQTTTYTLITKYSVKDASHFGKDHGLQVNSSFSWQKVTVNVETLQSVTYNQLICSNNSPMILYKAFVTSNSTSLNHSANDGTVFRKGFAGIMGCSTTRKTDGKEFVKNNSLSAAYWIHNGDNWRRWHKPIDVKITLTLEGSLKLSDVIRIKTPGTSMLFAKDFVKQKDYASSHDCNENNTGVCAELNKVRSIPDLNKTDVIIQAHRGIWGKPNTNQENTIGAMIAAKNKGYKLLESDIMPIAVSNYTNPGNTSTFGVPGDLAAFHDFVLKRYTSASSGFIFNNTRSFLSGLSLKKPRSESLGTEKIMFFNELINYAANNNLIVCVDMKNLESKGQGGSCTELCNWQTQERKNISLYNNLKYAINSTPEAKLKNIAIKTYAKYDDLKAALTTGSNAVSVAKFDKILWAPLIAGNPQWEGTNGNYDVNKIQKFLDDWFAHNESVLYYETNFFNDFDNKTSVMLNDLFCFLDSDGNNKCGNVMEYIYNMTGRRAGIFSEEPVGGKGTVNRWGKWGIKNPVSDRRGDHLWLLKQPFFKHAVITTDRPDQWNQLKD